MWYIETTAKRNISLEKNIKIKKGEKITISHGIKCKYALWHNTGIYDLPEKYINFNEVENQKLT
jgi:hypothetical protein